MIIDCHTHIGRSGNIMAATDQLLYSMDQSGIDKAFVFAGALGACPTDYMLAQIAPHKDRLYGVAGVHPPDLVYGDGAGYLIKSYNRRAIIDAEVKVLQELYTSGQIVAAKFYLGYDHYYPNQIPQYLKGLEKVGCPAIFHCGDCLNSVKKAKLKYAQPLGVDDVAVDYPGMNFIIAHIGNPFCTDTAAVCYKNENVYTDISGFVYGNFSDRDRKSFKKVIDSFLDITGSGDKLLFGTDWPISNQQSYLDCLRNDIGSGLTPEYLTSNTIRAFKLNDAQD